ncbi:MAG: leucine-rich repeat protein [Clostridia bacterium]|nr:leucine-rich repeat protein [Clostridia bacterium]
MSKLNGIQIFALLSDVHDNLIVESIAPTLLTGGVTVGAAALIDKMNTSDAAAADPSVALPGKAKGGFGAWLVRGGWVALLAGVLVAAGIVVGVFLPGKSGDTPPVGSDEVTAAGVEQSEPEDTINEEETDPLPRLEDFSNESILSLFSAEQGTLSVNQDGDLVLDAVWKEGDINRSALVFDPQKVMNAMDRIEGRTHGAVLIKARRTMAMPTAPTVSLGTEDFGRLADRPAETVYRYATGDIDYEYFLIDTEYLSSLQNGMTPLLYLEWVCMEEGQYSSAGRSMTIHEIAFYPDIWSAFLEIRERLDEDGVKQPTPNYYQGPNNTIFANTTIRVPFFYPEPKGPNGEPIPRIAEGVFSQSNAMTVAILSEGFTELGRRCLSDNNNLRAVYFPDSLTELTVDIFNTCPRLTRLRLGKNIRTIHNDAIPFDSLTDIDYDGTMEEWCRVERVYDFKANVEIIVHCLDGDLTYYAESVEDGQPSSPSDTLLYNTPFELEAGWTPIQVEAQRLNLSNAQGLRQEVVLRWALVRQVRDTSDGHAIPYRYYFDVISSTDGSTLYKSSFAEMEAYAVYKGASLLLAYDAEEKAGETATLFLTNYGYGEADDALCIRTTHFRLELAENGTITVNRNASGKLNTDATFPCPINGYAEMNKTRRVFRDIEDYIGDTYGFSNRSVRLLMVSRPHGDSVLFNTRQGPTIDGFFFGRIWNITADFFNAATLEELYESYGAYKKLN